MSCGRVASGEGSGASGQTGSLSVEGSADETKAGRSEVTS